MLNRRTLLAAAGVLATAGAFAQTFPSRPITIVIGFPPGGNIDAVARLIQPALSEQLGQTIVIDNKPGASGIIGASSVARANPDGYTLALLSLGHATSASMVAKLPYDAVNDFKAVAQLTNSPFVITTPVASSFRSVADVVNAARQKPQQVDYGTAGVGTGMHLFAELFQTRAGVKLHHIPYKGGPQVQVALLGNEVPLVFSTPAVTVPMKDEGKVRVLAVTSRERFPAMPDVPTLAELGYGDVDVNDFMLLAAPKGTPDAVVARIHAALAATLVRPEIRAQLAKLGTLPVGGSVSPAAVQQLLGSEVERWRKVIQEAGIPVAQ